MVTLRYIGKSADDLRFFILSEGVHAGGITVHSVHPPRFSYGIAVAPALRRRGVAKAALLLLFEEMKGRGFSQAVVQVAPGNATSLALHASLGFEAVSRDGQAVTLVKELSQTPPDAAP